MGIFEEAFDKVSDAIEYTIYRCTDFNAGKFFDVPATNKYFADWHDAFTTYENDANEHFLAIDDVATTDTWMGVDADAAKTMLSDTETTLLEDILKLHDDIDDLHETILENFKLTVDSAPDAYISYDDLMTIENDFKEKSEAYNAQVKTVEDMVQDLQEKYSKYGTIRTPDFSAGKNAFTKLCGDDETVGYLEECRQKLVQFDTETQILIEDADIDSRVDDLNQRMASFIVENHPEYLVKYLLNTIDDKYADFMVRYNVDEETMQIIDEWIESYNPDGDNEFEKLLIEMQGMSETDWKNMDADMKQKYAAVVAMYAYAGYVIEHGDQTTENIENYQSIFCDITKGLYKVKWGNEENGFNNANVALNGELASSFIGSLYAIGAQDTLAMNIVTKIQSDNNQYYQFQEYNELSGFDVVIGYTEEGLVEVTLGDINLEHGSEKHQFLAVGKDMATSLYSTIRNEASSPDKHGLTQDELVGLFLAVENKNDLQILKNVIASDTHFEIDGENVFNIDFKKNNSEGYYSKNISDGFSLAFGSMGTLMLYHGATTSYEEFMNAALIASYADNSNHNIVFDICIGAGLYADVSALAVYKDEEGGDNDVQLERMLNAANANYGAWAQLYSNVDYESQINPNGPKEEEYVKFHCMNLEYNYNTGEISFDVYCDYKHPRIAGTSGGVIQYEYDTDRKYMFKANTQIYIGEEAEGEYLENLQIELKKELVRKKEALAYDTVVGMVSETNPILGGVISGMKAIGEGDVDEVNGDTTSDIIGEVFEDKEMLCNGVSSLNKIIDGYLGYRELNEEYEKAYGKTIDLQKISMGYSYNSGTGTVGLYNYEMIRLYRRWNDQGISSIYKSVDNNRVYNEIISKGEINKDALVTITKTLLNIGDNELKNPNGSSYTKEQIYGLLNDEGYTDEEINAAMEYLIKGKNGEQTIYDSIYDIPFEIKYACVTAINKNSGLDDTIFYELEKCINEN